VTIAIIVAGVAIAVVAAARSTWSPCGLSMLSSITPIGERGRGHRFASTAAWFVAGAVIGGATLGAAMSVLAAGVAAIGMTPTTRLVVAGVAAALTAGVDLGLTGIRIPVIRRQVNEIWLDQFRSWVYGAGFGWQIGVGFATYVMTAAVVLTVVLGALTASPWLAFGLGLAFGTFRGLTVFIGISVTSPARLQQAHRRLAALRRPAWIAVIVAQVIVAVALVGLAWWPSLVVVGVAAAAALVVSRARVLGGIVARAAEAL
jgi:hypothetical protein